MSITTFVLTFFLSQAYALWRNIYTCGRKIQGRLNDVSLVLACSVERNKNGEYTDRGLLLLNDVAMSCRLCHAFSWAGFVKRYQILLSPRGLSRMLRCVVCVCVCVFCILVSFCILYFEYYQMIWKGSSYSFLIFRCLNTSLFTKKVVAWWIDPNMKT